MLPDRLTINELATLWKITATRVRQFIQAGKIRKGPDGKIDREEALAFRAAQIGQDEVRTLFQGVSNGSGPKVLEHLQAADDHLSAEDVLGLSPELPSGPAAISPDIATAIRNTSALTELRVMTAQEGLRRQKIRNDKEAGELLYRADVKRSGLAAGKIIASSLNGLPFELAAVFADSDTRAAVRHKVQETIDRVLFALATQLSAAARDDEDDD